MIWVRFSDRKDQKKLNIDDFMSEVELLIRTWREGDIQSDYLTERYTCPDVPNIPQIGNSFLKCNYHFLKCFINNRKFKYIKNLDISSNKNGNVRLDFENHSLTLKNNCHQTLLPQRWYGYSNFPQGSEDIVWNNFNRSISIDQFQVKNSDVILWDKTKVPKKILEDPSKWFLTAGYLLEKEMIQYCQDRGKQVMDALLFDAISFYPVFMEEPQKTPVFRVPNPWTVKYKNTFLNANLKLPMDKKSCALAYTRECLQFPIMPYFQNSISWAGVFQILGGDMEYMRNPIEPEKNIFASSSLYEVQSVFHTPGIRFHWDGKGHAPKNFDFMDPDEKKENIPVAFRCVKYD